jgi:hypothetical protein
MVENKNILLLIISILFLACTNAESKNSTFILNFESGFSLSKDTISVSIKGEMTHALKYHDKFYVLFKQRVLKYGGDGKRWLYIFSNGQVEKIIDCPKEMETAYIDFYAKNDSLILKPYMDKQSYYLDLANYRWTKIEKTDDLIFEDENFQIYSLDFGEWGGKTWFKEKKTGQEYVLEATTPLVNKIDSSYYLTNSFKVLKIENPRLLNECSDDITYENIESTGKSYSWYGEPIGFDVAYQDTTIDYFDFNYKSHIVSSFVLGNELLHIYETDTATYIARHKSNHTIEPIQKIVDNISFYNWHYSYRCSNLNGNNELLKFHTQDEQVFGLMEIIDNKIQIHYFLNEAVLEPQLIGTVRADSIFVNRLNAILFDFSKLELSKIDSDEQIWGSFDITPNHKIGIDDSWNTNNYDIDINKSYLVIEDSIISNSIMYYATKKTDLVRAVTIDWEKTPTSSTEFENEKSASEVFLTRFNDLVLILTNEIGKPNTVNKKKNNPSFAWTIQNSIIIEIELYQQENYNSIRMVIYERK